MHPCVFGGLDMEPQRLQSLPFVCEISERYLEGDVVNGRSCCVRPATTGALGAVEQGEHPLKSAGMAKESDPDQSDLGYLAKGMITFKSHTFPTQCSWRYFICVAA